MTYKTSKIYTLIWVLANTGVAGTGEGGSILLENPSHPAYLGTFKIAVKPGGNEIRYLSGARWSDQAPNMVARYLKLTLENDGGYVVSTARQAAISTDYRLSVDIRQFSTEVSPGQNPVAFVELNFRLIDAKKREVLKTKGFASQVGASQNSNAAIAAAFQEAMDSVSQDVVRWLKSGN